MDHDVITPNLVRVGVLALTYGDDLLDGVGHSAWHASGGEEIEQSLPPAQFGLLRMLTLPAGKREEVAAALRDWCDAPNPSFRCDLILTLGGDGFRPGDVVPEATRDVLDREAPALADALRQFAVDRSDDPAAAMRRTAMCRGIAGMRKQSLIVNIPGCFERPAEAVDVLLPLLPGLLGSIESK